MTMRKLTRLACCVAIVAAIIAAIGDSHAALAASGLEKAFDKAKQAGRPLLILGTAPG